MKQGTIYGTINSGAITQEDWGTTIKLFENWGELNLTGKKVTFQKETEYALWSHKQNEDLCVVESGNGTIIHNEQEYQISEGYAFKVFPGNGIDIQPEQHLTIFAVQRPKSDARGSLEIVNVAEEETKVYEYEALAQEIFTKEGELGLLTFIFPIREIPIHIHPQSGRLIRTISGKGWTYCEPEMYEMNEETFSLFPQNTVHTNGPVPGEIYKVYAFQLPYVNSEIDTENIAGSPKFVKYIGETPPKKFWKRKEDFLRVMERLSR